MPRCPRCGLKLPYLRSKRWRKPREPRASLFIAGKDCPRCGRRTVRQPTPLWFRPVRLLTLHRCSYRGCKSCRWQGPAFHDRRESGPARAA